MLPAIIIFFLPNFERSKLMIGEDNNTPPSNIDKTMPTYEPLSVE